MKILFICSGNTCRSPMAEALMKSKCRGLNDITVSSCGLYAFSGDSASQGSIEAMKHYGIDLTSHRARAFSEYMIDEYDLFVVMTNEHMATLSQIVAKDKIIVLGGGIPDPYGMDVEAYINCADKICSALESILAMYQKTEIVHMGEAHLKAIAEIEAECFSDPWSEDALRSELSNDGACFFAAVKNGEVAGYMGMHTVLDECYIANVAVKTSYRRQGIAESLLDTAEKTAKDKHCSFISLEVRVSNTPAINLYKKRGYISQGERKNFYSHPTENALIMTKTFSEE